MREDWSGKLTDEFALFYGGEKKAEFERKSVLTLSIGYRH